MLAPELKQKQQTEVITQGPSSFSLSELRNFSNHKLPINAEPSAPPTRVLPAGTLGFPPPLSIIFFFSNSFLLPHSTTSHPEQRTLNGDFYISLKVWWLWCLKGCKPSILQYSALYDPVIVQQTWGIILLMSATHATAWDTNTFIIMVLIITVSSRFQSF